MGRANPEVKLALAAERGLRRPAAQLRALLAAAGRRARGDDPAQGLLDGPDPLAVLAALIEAPAPAASGRAPGRERRASPPPAAPGGVRPRALAASHDGVSTAPRRALAGGGPVVRDLPARASPVATADPRPGGPARRLAQADIAQRRDALRRAVASTPLPAPAPMPKGSVPRLSLSRRGGTDPAEGPALPALVAVAGPAAPKGAEARLSARATERAPIDASPLADMPQEDAAPPDRPAPEMRPLPLQPWDSPAPAVAPRGAAAPQPAASPLSILPMPRLRPAVPLRLDDDADALSEAAWRNGVDGP